MNRRLVTLSLALSAALMAAQACSQEAPTLNASLAFEVPLENGLPEGWRGGPAATIALDHEIVHTGSAAARIDRDGRSAAQFTSLTMAVPIDFQGATIELRGFLRTESVSDFTGLWMRVDGFSGPLAFDNMQRRKIDGTRDWTEFVVELPLLPAGRDLVFGVLLSGSGTVWADDLEILVDGKPLAEAPRVERTPTVLDNDKEFDSGSGIAIDSLSSAQVQNLVVLGKMWGFLKYHHPRVAEGRLHWDYELFRVLPDVLAAGDAAERNALLLAWGQRVGVPDPCDVCATQPTNAALKPDVGWIQDTLLLGGGLSAYLESVYRNRYAEGDQFYLATMAQGALNPIFDHELPYRNMPTPDAGYRLLALFRYWNAVEYWFPNRDVIGEPWTNVLEEFVPVFAAAGTRDSYALALLRLIARIRDTHASLNVGGGVTPPRGECQAPVAIRFIEGKATVAAYSNEVEGPSSGLRIGDVILAIDGDPVARLITEWAPYYPASNEPRRLSNMARVATRGPCEPATLRVERGGETFDIAAERVPPGRIDPRTLATHDRPGETFQWLTDDVAYLKLSSIKQADVVGYIEQAQRARGLIVDIRNYPSEFVVFALGGHLVQAPVEFAAFTRRDLSNPGAFVWGYRPVHQPTAPYYRGKVVILVDETTLSQAEYTAMALRAAPSAIVVGSTTAGADGNVSFLSLPGGFQSGFSGLGVFYPDGTPTQRVGIVPDVYVTPSVEGIASGRDEVLEQALREIAGDELEEETIREIGRSR